VKSALLLTGFFLLCAMVFVSPRLLRSMLPGTGKDPLAGTWFGVVDVRALGDPLPGLEENSGNAVMRLSLSHTILTRLNTYKGSGEITDDHGNKRQIEVHDLSLLPSGRIAGALASSQDQGALGGALQDGVLTLNPATRTGTFHLQGVLHPGDEAGYRHLCDRMQATQRK